MEAGKSHLTRRDFERSALAFAIAAALPAWPSALDRHRKPMPAPQPSLTGPDSLRFHAERRGLLYGAAVNPKLLDVDGLAGKGTEDGYTRLVLAQAGMVVAENAMKWDGLRPTPDTFDFTQSDRLVRFAGLASQAVRGHNLCWHRQLPSWFQIAATRENARQLLVQHIQVVAGRYQGELHSWDVVNEAIEPSDGRSDGLRKSPWLELIGPDYIELAFHTATAADPKAKLTYNDYGIELDTPEQSAKRGHVLMLLRRLKARGVPIHAVGVQSHLQANGPQPGGGLLDFVREAGALGLEVYVTEMDVNTHGLPGSPEAQDAAVAQVYRNYLGLMLGEPNVLAVVTWGISSAHSWLNEIDEDWARRPDGARQRPLPFDDRRQPTPAFMAIRSALDAAHPAAAAPSPPPATAPAGQFKPFPVEGSPTKEQ